MDTTLIYVTILGVLFGLTEGVSVLPEGPVSATVNDTVIFTTTLPPTEIPFLNVEWHFGTTRIISSRDNNITAPEFVGRITLFISTGSLELRNVTLADSGEYRVNIIPQEGIGKAGSTRLNVYVPVSNVRVNVSSTDLVEFTSSVNLSCSSSGSPVSFVWLNGSSEVTAGDRVEITDGGTSMRIVSVTQYDQGPFQCYVSNPVSNDTSHPVWFSISYGPHNVEVIGSVKLEVGQPLVFFCSAESTPAASYSWIRNGEIILNNSTVFVKPVTETSDSGVYICEAANSVTGRSSSGQLNMSVHAVPEPEVLSDGAIAGIVIGYVIFIGAACGGVAYAIIIKKKMKKKKRQETIRKATEINARYDTKPSPSPAVEDDIDSIYENATTIYEGKI